jgi:hypothetical protein
LTDIATTHKLAQVFRETRETDPNFGLYESGISAALQSEETPDEIKMMLSSGNLDHMRSAVNFLKPYARLEAIKAGTQTPAPPQDSGNPPAEDSSREEARRDAARRTAIVTGSQRLQAAGADQDSGELTSEQRIARFKEAFEEEPSTEISAGLTINGQPVQPVRPRR